MTGTARVATGLTILALLAAGCSNSEQSKKQHFDNATRFMEAGKTQEAIVEYRNALKTDSKYGEARLRLSEAYQAAGNTNQAYREAIRAADLLPKSNEAQLRAVRYLLAAGQFDDAKARIQPVIDRDPTNAEAQLALGNALVGLKDLDGAVREIEEAIKLEPNRGLTYSNLAAVKMAQGQKDQAKAAFEKAVEVDPKAIQPRLILAYFRWSIGDLAAAEETLKTALEIDPKNVLANRTLATFYMGSNRAAMAEPYFKALAGPSDPQASIRLADYYLSLRRTSDAAAVLQPLTKTPSVAAAAELRLAAISYAANDRPKAHSLVDGLIAREPNNVQARMVKGGWLLQEGKGEDALSQAQAAVKIDNRRADAHFFLGSVYEQLRRRKEAIGEFSETLRLNPRAAAAQLRLSRLNLAEGSPDSAVTFAEGALSNSPGNADARVSLVRGLLAKRDVSRAQAEVAALLKQYPQAGLVHALNGNVKLQQKDVTGARLEFEKALSLTPTSIDGLAGLTAVDLIQKKVPEARQRIDARLAAEPKRVDLLVLASQVYMSQRDFAKAESSLRTAIQADPSALRPYSMLAATLVAAGKLDAARVEFDQMVQRDPKAIGPATMAAMIVHSQNKTDEAKKRYETIVGANPGAAVAANNLAWIYAEEGDKLDDALRLAQSAAARLPENPEVQDTIGWIYYKKELPALAVPAFEKSVEKAPENPTYHYHLALALAKAGDTQRARQAVAQAIKLKPDYPEAQKLLAQTKG